MTENKEWQWALGSALVGLLVAALFFVYFETDPDLESSAALWMAGLSIVLCPGSLLFVTWIDVEPQTSGFIFVWSIIGAVNVGVYGAIGMVVGLLRWKAGRGRKPGPALKVGDIAPPLGLPDAAGARVRLEDFRGRAALVSFLSHAA